MIARIKAIMLLPRGIYRTSKPILPKISIEAINLVNAAARLLIGTPPCATL